jgi:glycosyltransferase involved in cell wall biosynthesis
MADDRRIRVLHLVTRMNVGGVAVLIDNLLDNIDSSKYEVLLVTGSCEAPEGDYLDSRNPKYRFIRLATFHKSLDIKDDVSSVVSLTKIIREFKPDIIHTHTSKAGLYGRVLARLFSPKSKIVHTFHGHLLVGYFNPIKLSIVKLIEKTLSQLSDSLVAMGTQVRDDLVSAKVAPKAKFSVFFPGLNFPEFPTRSAARESLNLDSNQLYCVFIGRLTQIKRPDRLLEVSKVVSQSNPQVKFLVVGDGDLANEMREKSKTQKLPVQFLGWRQDISTILAAADLLILTSDNEAVALTLIEASQAGIPVVTTPAGSVRDIAVDGLNGYVTEFTPESLASKVLVLAESADLRKQMGAAGKDRARELFSISHMVKSHELLYMELLSS